MVSSLTPVTPAAPVVPAAPVAPTVPSTTDINASLNTAQDLAHTDLSSSPTSDLDAAKARANTLINSATENIGGLNTKFDNSTTGDSSIAARTDAAYAAYGFQKPDFKALSDDVANATEELKNVQVKKTDNITQRENQLAGTGATETDATNIDKRDQRTISLQELAAATKLQVAQMKLNNATDIFKELSTQSETEQAHYISTISQQLNLNKADLTAGLDLMKQAITEEHGDVTAAKSLIVGLAQNYPNFFNKLTPSDQQALTQGQITPTILSTIGTLQTNKDAALQIQQQNADTRLSSLLGYTVPSLAGNGVAPGTKTLGYQRLQLDAQKIQGGGSGSIDSVATAQAMADTFTSIDQVPSELKGYFQQKRDALGNSYLVPKVAKGQTASFASTYQNYIKTNSSPNYAFNPVPADPSVMDPNQVFGGLTQGIAAGKSITDLRSMAASNGTPLTVWKKALNLYLQDQTAASATAAKKAAQPESSSFKSDSGLNSNFRK